MQKTNTVKIDLSYRTNDIDIIQVSEGNVASVVSVIISSENASNCCLILYKGIDLLHKMNFYCQANKTIFINNKLFIPEGYSLKVNSDKSNTIFTVMYDQSQNI